MKSNIKVVEGDITQVPEGINLIMHQANTHNVMGAGVALALVNLWPEVLKVDNNMYAKEVEACSGYETIAQANLLGRFSITGWLDNYRGGFVRIMNLYGQRLGIKSLAGCATDYNAVVKDMHQAAILVNLIQDKEKKPITVGLPYLMGCGLAGGDWQVYSAIIRKSFASMSFKVVIVKFSN